MRQTDRTSIEADGRSLDSTQRRRGSRAAAAEGPDADERASEVGELQKYLAHLAHLDMAMPLKIELIRTLRAIMQNFVDRVFGDDPVQQALASRDKSIGKDDPSASPVLDWEATADNQPEDLATTFRDPAAGAGRRK